MEPTPKIALITGGSRGLGKNAALRLAEKNVGVILTYQSRQAEAEAVVDQIRQQNQQAVALPLNVADTKSFAAFFTRVEQALRDEWHTDQFHFLINNAGIDAYSPFPETTEEAFDALCNVHFKGVYFLTQKALPLLADGGRMVLISTGLTRFTTPGYAAYAATKGAVEVLTRYLAKELGPRQIAVNCLAPGLIETDFTQATRDGHPGLTRFIASQTALGRVGQPDDIGKLVALLCAAETGWVNAQRIEASGGMFL